MDSYHDPVLLDESVEALNIKKEGIYVDATYGGGGHSRLILQKLGAKGHLLGFDQDEDTLSNVTENEQFTFVHHNFKHLKRFLRLHAFQQVDGILADLGVSSHQLNDADRGFSFRFDTDLDMRMNQQGDLTAADILNDYDADALQQVFSLYGEVRNSKSLAQRIVDERKSLPLKRIGDFLQLVGPLVRGNRNRYLAQVFQALRIEVNDEIGALKTFLEEALQVLKPGGRLVVISYHSLEDRLVKNFFKSGNFTGELIKDFYGNIERPFNIITKKAFIPSQEEIKINPRARSAKMRVAEKI
ncbi:MAG: 16S rRNA (cytosine1402-N4)-methyltransferase [Saprospiraceae bacterium]|jgi:16S rRNA (cytosine1402-N4)-methyltransferase